MRPIIEKSYLRSVANSRLEILPFSIVHCFNSLYLHIIFDFTFLVQWMDNFLFPYFFAELIVSSRINPILPFLCEEHLSNKPPQSKVYSNYKSRLISFHCFLPTMFLCWHIPVQIIEGAPRVPYHVNRTIWLILFFYEMPLPTVC